MERHGHRFKNIIGLKFGKLTVIKESDFPHLSDSHVYWECLCDCGQKTIVNSNSLMRGYTRSCGCLRNKEMRNNYYADKNRA